MSNTYTQIHIHVVFAVKYRAAVIDKTWKAQLYKYITSIIQNESHKVLQINGMPDHVHILIGQRPKQSLSDLMKLVKGQSSVWINKSGFCKSRFAWQEGYGAFAYTKSDVPLVIHYIQNQEEHHRKKSFLEEYKEFLQEHDVDYDQRYIFSPVA